MSFKGITNEYRTTDEYKELLQFVLFNYPQMPMYLAEMAIAIHKTDPDLGEDTIEEEMRKYKAEHQTDESNDNDFCHSMRIYTAEEFSKLKQTDSSDGSPQAVV